jgi:hypothetical protein
MRLIDIVFRPIKTSRLILRILRDCEVEVKFNPQRKPKVDEKMSEFIVIGYDLMMPASSFKLIEDTIVLVEGSAYGENRIWSRKKKQGIEVQKVSFAQAVAMCVNEKLEAANGN